MSVISFWDYLLPSTLFLVCSCFSELLCYCCFSNTSLKPNLVAFFPPWDVSYPSRGRISSFSSFLRRSPSVGIDRGDRRESFYPPTAPVDIGIRGFEEGIPQDEVVSSDIRNKKGVRGFLAVVID